MKMATLYELGSEFLRLTELLESEELTEEQGAELAQMFALNDADISQKARGYRMVLAEMKASENALAEEIDRLTARKKVCQNAQERLNNRLREVMIATGRDEIDGGIGKFRLQNKPQSVEVDDQSLLTEFYLRIIPEKREPDKAKIKEALRAGNEVPGARLSAPEKMLRVI